MYMQNELDNKEPCHSQKVGRLQTCDASQVIFLKQDLLAVADIVMGEGQTKDEAAEDKKKLYATVAVFKKSVQQAAMHLVAEQGSFAGKITVDMEKEHEYDGDKTDSINLWKIQLIGGDPPEFIVNISEHL